MIDRFTFCNLSINMFLRFFLWLKVLSEILYIRYIEEQTERGVCIAYSIFSMKWILSDISLRNVQISVSRIEF